MMSSTGTTKSSTVSAVSRKKRRRANVIYEAPFPVPVSSEPRTPSGKWNFYSGYIEGSFVVVKHAGDKQWLYSMGFFGKGNFSRSQPTYNQQKCSEAPRIISKRRYLRHSTWSKMAALKNSEPQAQDDLEVDRQIHLNKRKMSDWPSVARTSVKSPTKKPDLSTNEISSEPMCDESHEIKVCDMLDYSVPAADPNMIWAEDDEGFWSSNLSEPTEKDTKNEILNDTVKIDKNIPNFVPNTMNSDTQLSNLEVKDSSREDVLDSNSSVGIRLSNDNTDNCKEILTKADSVFSSSDHSPSESGEISHRSTELSSSSEILEVSGPSLYQMQHDTNGDILVHADTDDEDYEGTEMHWRLKKDPYPISEDLFLTLEEAFFLSYGLGCLLVHDSSGAKMNLTQMWQSFCKISPSFVPDYVVYHYLRSKGWVPKPGLKYGSEFVVYKKGPPFYHSSFSVKVLMVTEDLMSDPSSAVPTWTSLSGFDRLTEHVAKDVLLCYVIRPSHLTDDHLESPKYIPEFKVKEYLLRRWVPSHEREMKNEEISIDIND